MMLEFQEIKREHVKLAIDLAEQVARRLQAAETDPFVLVAVAALLVGGYAHASKVPIGELARVVEELASHFDQPGSRP